MTLHKQIREAREARELSQEALANVAGLHYRTIQNLEAGHRPSITTIRRVSEALDLNWVELIEMLDADNVA